MEPSENSSMISRARVRSRARKAGRVPYPSLLPVRAIRSRPVWWTG
jgi:hypothetical protein